MSATAAAAPERVISARRVSVWRIPRSRSLLALMILGAVAGVVVLGARLYTDVLWFREVGQVEVLWTTLKWKILSAAVVGLGTAFFVLINLTLVDRAVSRLATPADGGTLASSLWTNRRLIKPAVAVGCGAIALSLRSPDAWQLLPVWTKRTSFGVEDPLLHRDVGFFVFSLPLYHEVARWLLETVVIVAIVSVAAYAAAGVLRIGRRRDAISAARFHLLGLAALLLVVLAWRWRLEQFDLALPHDPVVPGATYTDVKVRLLALRVLFVVALLGALACLYMCIRPVPVLAAALLVTTAVLAVGAMSDLPRLVHRFAVEPQSLARERPHVADGIAFTRRAYALDGVQVTAMANGSELSQADVAAARDTLDNVPLWDAPVIRSAMNELQSIGRYYHFPSVSVDRYMVDGKQQVMTVGARELSLRQLRTERQSFGTGKLAYTHGYGVAAMHGGDAGAGRYPRFAQQDFGARANPLGLEQPRVYFGQQSGSNPPYLVLDTGRAEVDEPISGDSSPRYHYDGEGGIAISDPLRRLAFATRFGDLDLLLSETVTRSSRILMHRNAGDRVRTLAPFLRWDDQAQTAVIDGRVQFLFAGYTTSNSYPYSAPVEMGHHEVNYVRASALAAVDAFGGRVTIYADGEEPIMRAWQAVYPGLFEPWSQIPPQLLAHMRYPRRLFEAQSDIYETFHAEDATAFWNGSDEWTRASQLAGPVEDVGEVHFPDPAKRADPDARTDGDLTPRGLRMQPAYGLARLPGDASERFMLTTAYTPRGRENLVSHLAGSLDANGRGQLTLLSLPRDRHTAGPTQATRRILSSAGVVGRLGLLNRESRDLGKSGISRTVLGVPRIVPIAGTLVYVQPLYLTAGGEGVPRLQLVTTLANGRVGYGGTLTGALRRSVASSSGR